MRAWIGLLAAALVSVLLAPTASAQEQFFVCPDGRSGVATLVTSCPFAQNVRLAYFGQSSNPVLAYSPVTGEVYRMYCISGIRSTLNAYPWQVVSARCSGGNNAVVIVW